MATDLRQNRINMPVIPSAKTVRKRLAEVLADAEKLKVLLRLASELEGIDADQTDRTPANDGCPHIRAVKEGAK